MNEQHSALTSNPMAEVAAERERQKSAEGWDPAHDDTHDGRELARAAGAYVQHYYERQWLLHLEPETYRADEAPDCWPWDLEWWKPKDARRDLIRAAALVVAEIERLDRKAGNIPTSNETFPVGLSEELRKEAATVKLGECMPAGRFPEGVSRYNALMWAAELIDERAGLKANACNCGGDDYGAHMPTCASVNGSEG